MLGDTNSVNFLMFGMSHKTAPIKIREQFYLSEIQQDLLLSELKHISGIVGAFVVSTCNRIEVYCEVGTDTFDVKLIQEKLFIIKKIKIGGDWQQYFYAYRQDLAFSHLLKVTTSLDSLVLGEKQVLGQVKIAFEKSAFCDMLSGHLNLMQQVVVRSGKLAHAETDIGYGGTSVSWAAVNFAEDHLNGLEGKRVMVLGCGQMGELAAKKLSQRSLDKLYIMNRTKEKAKSLAQRYGGQAVSFLELIPILKKVDVCLCAIEAPHYVIEKESVQQIMRSRKAELLMIDISMPRTIDPDVALFEQVKLYAIDDLGKTLEKSIERRNAAVKNVYEIIDRKMAEFYVKLEKMDDKGWRKKC
jgi:glutamyl-tRNA reductase